jgi:hypothetical protein
MRKKLDKLSLYEQKNSTNCLCMSKKLDKLSQYEKKT